MIKRIYTSLLFLFFITYPLWGQVGEMYANRKAFNGEKQIRFDSLETHLTYSALDYLNEFGRTYQDSMLAKQSVWVILKMEKPSPEQKTNADLTIKRVEAITSYLIKHFGFDESQFKLLTRETRTFISEGFIRQKARKKKVK